MDDKRTGRGIYRFVNGDRYEGQFLNGKRDGIGFYVEGERVFVEEWDDGIRLNRTEIPGGALPRPSAAPDERNLTCTTRTESLRSREEQAARL